MLNEAANAAAGAGLLSASFLYGMRHGVDVDHLAAIADIAGIPERPRRSFALASLYAGGHALVLSLLGGAAIILGRHVPPGLDMAMQRLVGATLMALGIYLAWQLLRDPRTLRLQSRWTLAASVGRSIATRLRPPPLMVIEHEHEHSDGHHEHQHDHEFAHSTSGAAPADEGSSRRVFRGRTHSHRHHHVGELPPDPFDRRVIGAVTTGAIHGVGAETPTQVLLFATAAGADSTLSAIMVLGAFVMGLFAANTIVALICVAGFRRGDGVRRVYLALVTLTSLLSVAVGGLYLVGRGDLLPGA